MGGGAVLLLLATVTASEDMLPVKPQSGEIEYLKQQLMEDNADYEIYKTTEPSLPPPPAQQVPSVRSDRERKNGLALLPFRRRVKQTKFPMVSQQVVFVKNPRLYPFREQIELESIENHRMMPIKPTVTKNRTVQHLNSNWGRERKDLTTNRNVKQTRLNNEVTNRQDLATLPPQEKLPIASQLHPLQSPPGQPLPQAQAPLPRMWPPPPLRSDTQEFGQQLYRCIPVPSPPCMAKNEQAEGQLENQQNSLINSKSSTYRSTNDTTNPEFGNENVVPPGGFPPDGPFSPYGGFYGMGWKKDRYKNPFGIFFDKNHTNKSSKKTTKAKTTKTTKSTTTRTTTESPISWEPGSHPLEQILNMKRPDNYVQFRAYRFVPTTISKSTTLPRILTHPAGGMWRFRVVGNEGEMRDATAGAAPASPEPPATTRHADIKGFKVSAGVTQLSWSSEEPPEAPAVQVPSLERLLEAAMRRAGQRPPAEPYHRDLQYVRWKHSHGRLL